MCVCMGVYIGQGGEGDNHWGVEVGGKLQKMFEVSCCMHGTFTVP